MRVPKWVCLVILTTGLVLVAGVAARAQINTADLSGQVLDPQGLAVAGAKVTVRSLATGATRTAEADDTGRYRIVGLPPGRYELTVDGGKGLTKLVNPEIVLTIGQSAEFDAHLQLQAGAETVTVTEATELIETARTAVAETVDQRRINNLPINGRNYINFTLTDSRATRDSAPSIGAAPTSGINFGGQRARSNQVSVDGADAVDNSVNGIRATVSQEAVQEFQLIESNYMPEFGRATGGVINIVTKAGSNEVHGNVFGFLRHKSIQARNPFSVSVDPTSGALIPTKQAFTRVQAGATIGGPIKKDKTFYFFSYETTRRQETGFTSVGANNFDLPTTPTPVPAAMVPFIGPTPGILTPLQAAFATTPIPGLPPAADLAIRAAYFALVRSGSQVGLNGRPGIDTFFISGAPLPASFVSLNSIRGSFPVSEGTSLWSARIDHQWNSRNSSFARASVSPSLVTGIQVNAQNQNFGQNAGSRTSVQQSRDVTIVGQHVTSFTNSVFNEARFQYARRGVHYGFSQLPGGSQVAVNIIGFAFFGREPFSTVDRIERRFQWTDNVSWLKGHHTFKTGVDINLIQIRSKKTQIFELNFGGLFDFGATSATPFVAAAVAPLGISIPSSVNIPSLKAVQAYGIGFPGRFIQGIGNSNKPFENKAFAFFVQDSWKVHTRLTLNYGVRYDVELTPQFTPDPFLNAAAEAALGVVDGIPHDKNNWSPRFGLAWDPRGNGKTLVRAGYGIFFDHPLLGVAFLSTANDGATSAQLITGPGAPSATGLNAASIFQGVLANVPLPGGFSFDYISSQQRFDPKASDSIFFNQNYMRAGVPITLLPFTLPVAGDFVYGYAQQGNLTIEQQLGHDYKFSVSYTYTHGLHLNRPRNINSAITALQIQNADRAVRAGLLAPGSTTKAVVVPAGAPGGCVNSAGGGSILLTVPQVLGTGFTGSSCGGTNVGFIGTAAVFNFFRPSGPNPSFAALFPGGYGSSTTPLSEVFFAGLAGFPTGFPGIRVPYSDVVQQESSGNSVYHGLTLAFSKRFANHFEFLSSYTWSHAIDDSTDLQSLLTPQNDRRPNLERGNSTFDQRHRWVTSAVMQSPFKRSDDGFWRKFLADFTVAPIIEVASGRPFTVLSGNDFADSFSPNGNRPSTAASGGVQSPFLPGVHFVLPNVCDPSATGTAVANVTSFGIGCFGNLGRNTFVRPNFFQVDLRISRKFYFTEKVNLEFITDMFNLLNRNNIADVNLLCDPSPGSGACNAGQPTAALDPRQFQFALKINW